MSMQNDATGKQPTAAEEMERFTSVAFKDGEMSRDTAGDGASDQEAREARSAQINNRTHAENVAAGKTSVESDEGHGGVKAMELTEAEKDAAIDAATNAEGDALSAEEKQAVLDTALASKQRAAAIAARKSAKAARYSENHRAARAAERRADNLQRELDATNARLAALESGKPLTTQKAGGNNDAADKPDHTDATKYPYGELDPKYMADLARFEARASVREENEKKQTATQAKADKDAQDAFKEKVTAFAEEGDERYDDFQEIVMDNLASKENPEGWPCSPVLGEMLMESDFGQDIAYDLALDVPAARKVHQMTPAQLARWFSKKEAEHESAGSAANGNDASKTPAAAAGGKAASVTQIRESKAPKPPTKVQGKGVNSVPNAATTDFAQFEAIAMGQKR